MLSDEWQQHIASTVAHTMEMAGENFRIIASEIARPSAVWRPVLSIDGDQWCALYGANLQDGVAGFGESPAKAMDAFDLAWHAKLSLNQEGQPK